MFVKIHLNNSTFIGVERGLHLELLPNFVEVSQKCWCFFSRFPFCSSTNSFCFTLFLFMTAEENYDILLQESHKLLIACMKNFPKTEGVQTACFALIKTVAINSKISFCSIFDIYKKKEEIFCVLPFYFFVLS